MEKLTIKNITNILNFRHNSFITMESASDNIDETYSFEFTHLTLDGRFKYTIHRCLGDDHMGQNRRFVGTFGHPFGSHRQDCYECDVLDKQSFIYFLGTIVNDWAVQYKQ